MADSRVSVEGSTQPGEGLEADSLRDVRARCEFAEERLRKVAAMLRVPDGGRYLNDWIEYADIVNNHRAANAALTQEVDALRSRLQEAERALRAYADARNWAISRDEFRHPSAVWIGPGAEDKYPNAPQLARDALAAGGEHQGPTEQAGDASPSGLAGGETT